VINLLFQFVHNVDCSNMTVHVIHVGLTR